MADITCTEVAYVPVSRTVAVTSRVVPLPADSEDGAWVDTGFTPEPTDVIVSSVAPATWSGCAPVTRSL